MPALDIAEVARRSGMPASTLRYYEERGLIVSIGRRGLRRLFEPAVLQRLALISLSQTAGFTLDETAILLSDGIASLDREMLMRKADELDATVTRLAALRDGLRHVAACPAPNHLDCPKFGRLLDRALGVAPTIKRRPGRGLVAG